MADIHRKMQAGSLASRRSVVCVCLSFATDHTQRPGQLHSTHQTRRDVDDAHNSLSLSTRRRQATAVLKRRIERARNHQISLLPRRLSSAVPCEPTRHDARLICGSVQSTPQPMNVPLRAEARRLGRMAPLNYPRLISSKTFSPSPFAASRRRR